VRAVSEYLKGSKIDGNALIDVIFCELHIINDRPEG
jgi:hypothetical protein